MCSTGGKNYTTCFFIVVGVLCMYRLFFLCIYLCICLSIFKVVHYLFFYYFLNEGIFFFGSEQHSFQFWSLCWCDEFWIMLRRRVMLCKEVGNSHITDQCVFSVHLLIGLTITHTLLLLFHIFMCQKANYDNRWPECRQGQPMQFYTTAFLLFFFHAFSLLALFALNVVWYLYSGLLMYCWHVCSFDIKCNLYFG